MFDKTLSFIRQFIPDIIVVWCYKLYGEIFLLAHRRNLNDNRFTIAFKNIKMYMNDKSANTIFDAHYILHPAWAARIIAKNRPKKHIDISSTLSFSTIVSAFIPVEQYEYQPSKLNLTNLTGQFADLYNLPFKKNSISSLSCMHVVEHIGLGRYGDPLDFAGDIKAAKELSRILAENGTLLFVVPVGKPRICFNAHRIYSYELVLAMFPELTLKSFAMINDHNELIMDCDPSIVQFQKYACGCFEFTKSSR